MTANALTKPLPDLLPETRPFWEAASRHQLVLQKCRACGKIQFFPRLLCHACLNEEMTWILASGKGTVHTFTVIHQALRRCFAASVPYVYGIIDLEEGVRMLSNIVSVDPIDVRVGMKVRVVFEDRTSEISIPQFEPEPGENSHA